MKFLILNSRFRISIFMFLALILLIGCGTPPEPLEARITKLYPCYKPYSTKVIEQASSVFSNDVEAIFGCGELTVNRKSIAMSVNWYYENRQIFRETLYNAKGKFYSKLEAPEGGFEPGIYKIEVVIGKRPVRSVEFKVEKNL